MSHDSPASRSPGSNPWIPGDQRAPGGSYGSSAWYGAHVGLALVLLMLAVPVVIGWRGHSARPSMEAALEANNYGIGCMEQFRYGEAAHHFEEAVRLAPDWVPGQINLGIALLNINSPTSLKRAGALFRGVLQKDPDNLHAHFCLGVLLLYEKDGRDASHHFQEVLRRDPQDASSHAWLASLLQGRGQEDRSMELYERALQLNPYLQPALWNRYQHVQRVDPRRAMGLLEEFKELDRASWMSPHEIKYSHMGRYAEAIGRGPTETPRVGPLPTFERSRAAIHLARGTRWAASTDLGSDIVGKLRGLIRKRFGAALVVFDYDRDGKLDLFLAGAVVVDGKIHDLLLHNDGGGSFSDVTAEAGLAHVRPTLGCCVADLDNDGYPDLLLSGAGEQHLFRNSGVGRFKDISQSAGLEGLKGVCLGVICADIDQDADLDLLFCQYAGTSKEALEQLQGKRKGEVQGLQVYLHVGTAPVGGGKKAAAPLECKFEPAEKSKALEVGRGLVALAASDVDGDRDLDWMVLPERAAPEVVLNNRLLRFERKDLAASIPASAWNGGLVFDLDHDQRSDLLLLRAAEPPLLLQNHARPGSVDIQRWFEAASLRAPNLRQAVAIDLDLDSWTDIVAVDEQGQPIFLHNQGGALVRSQEFLPMLERLPNDYVAIASADLTQDGAPDMVLWSEKEGAQIFISQVNSNHALPLQMVGMDLVDPKSGNRMRCNADGIGVWIIAQAGSLWAGLENTTLSAGLGQSSSPVVLGMGRHERAQVVRLRWPDGSWQGEMDVPADGRPHVLVQSNRMPNSCPLLFTWNGQGFGFVADFLGGGSLGEMGPDGSCRPPRPTESVKIEAEQLWPRKGAYELRIAEPMSEIAYLDRLELQAIDHPADVEVDPDERFATSGPPATGALVVYRDRIFPRKARDDRGRDVTEILRERDRHMVDHLAGRAWIGFAEDHAIELDFGDALAHRPTGERLFLCLAGWTDYAWPQSIWAAQQAGVAMHPPVLERQDEEGHWQPLGEIGFPAGLPRRMLVEVTGKVQGQSCRLRLRSNLLVYWDQVYLAAGVQVVSEAGKTSPEHMRIHSLQVHHADLQPSGLMREWTPNGRLPKMYIHDRYDAEQVTPPAGGMTRYGNVTWLLRRSDDCFVVLGPGDELAAHFDASTLPQLPSGWKRSFVLRTRGYCKDTSPFTATGATVEPLPFGAMKSYPPAPGDSYPRDCLHRHYLRDYNTRLVTPLP